ncbi:Holliday junction resolvase Hjc [Pyrococcus yayanosii]|uniref:Crossover junction endodeoxyribonuclease Hjc n=1 Tax=Pyrococcus yayanosii (strain CH1 / JCM 16557) TaxID=529709 RepID=F8AEQ8_PYRYC|nr:Holliday junction resolvase Hjc [Pyrococcus yayanosii]AEH24740.1 Holliday junction resolvase [Pyrococcus yayanosii CH1]
MRYRRGAAAERELIRMLEERGFAVVRSAGSKRVDLVAGNGRIYLCIEVKSTRAEKLYVRAEDIERVKRFAERFGGVPVLAVKFVGRGWEFFRLDGGSRLRFSPGKGESLDVLLGLQRQLLEV